MWSHNIDLTPEGNILVEINDEVLGTKQIVGGYLNPSTISLDATGDIETYDDRGVFVNLPQNQNGFQTC